MVGPWPHAPSQVTLPSSADSRRVSCSSRTSGNTAPLATGTSVWPVSSSMRSVCSVSSSHQALPVTMVMPSTFTSGACSSASIAIWFEPPGPEPSWSISTRRFCAEHASAENAISKQRAAFILAFRKIALSSFLIRHLNMERIIWFMRCRIWFGLAPFYGLLSEATVT